MNNQRSFFFNIDWLTILIYLALCVIGWFNIHAAVYDPLHPSIVDMSTNYGKQFVFIITALILGLVIILLDSKFFSTFSPVFYGITLLLLITVLIVGRNVGGNQAWIPLGSFRLQPSEFAKFSTCLLLAHYISSTNLKMGDLKMIGVCIIILFIPTALIMLQPDTGSALTFTSLVFALYREGLSGYILIIGAILIVLFILSLLINKFILVTILVAIAVMALALFRQSRKFVVPITVTTVACIAFIFSVNFAYQNILQSHQRNRIDVILGKVNDPRGQGYNLNQSKIAIGSGGLWGKGYLQGTQTKYDFVPEQSTDFIFCTVGEEWGFAGSFVVIGLYLILLLRIINIAERQRSSFSRIYAYGVASIIFFHFFINIGMTIGLVPVIGIPLPFLSYGGSSLWSFTILLFILLKLDSNRMGII
ncbi:rod shape determining protein RodA [Arcticibacter tournemirensis]|uniref:Cell wall polymerase n=1 Tax=Arcticibacter tournemirensis TaxID=699437 RepID=A0A5M9H0R4_9SPHI|nr:rod shape-determining protein RodA [Arcticibacter tournemirensis]KAA8480170.1 rod shape-determining protein RodA [Arcticibacter tournemirensis]TQM52651.1 rod shape determining protein RodA [Arcticibacter tournemirensis]